MKRILLMVFRNLFFVPYGWFKLCWYASHAERYSEEQRYQLLKYVDNRAVKGGNLVIDGHGMENIPKENGFIFFPNHQGLFDVLAIIQVCPVPFSVVAKKELTNVPFLKQVFACMKAFMIDRDDVKQSMQVIINVIKEVKAGRNYLIFAEGTRSKDGNHPQEFKGGSFKAATKSKCPIVPVALIDSYKAFDTGKTFFGRDRHPSECDCQRAARKEREAAEKRRSHLETVERLKRQGFTDKTMQDWTFANDNGSCPQMKNAAGYVARWEQIKDGNYGLLLWGRVGTGKSYFAGCIANALMEQEVPVCMTNFAAILNDLAASFAGRNEYISRLCSFPLLIIDDFGMERGTEYGLEQVYNVIDSRYRSRKPLIVTTNLTLEELQHPEDTAHARIYDRLLEMCSPLCFTGENLRKAAAQGKMEQLKRLLAGKEICL